MEKPKTCLKGHTDLRWRKNRPGRFDCRTCRRERDKSPQQGFDGIDFTYSAERLAGIPMEITEDSIKDVAALIQQNVRRQVPLCPHGVDAFLNKCPLCSLKLPEPDRPKLNRAEEAPPRSLLIIPDIHVPVHHERAVDAMLEFATDVKPGMTVQLGDFYDVYGISSFLKHPKRMREKGGTLHEEAQAGRSIWLALLDASDDVRFLPGNHEFRVEREIVCNNPALFEHPALDLRGMFEIPDAVKVYPYDTKLKVGNINISHGHKLRGSLNKYSAANVLANYPNEVNVYGHGHRIDGCERTVYNADRPRYYGAFQIGWLGDYTKAEYTVDPNWQLGFMYVEFWQDDEGRTRFTPHQIRAVDGAFMFAGRRYG